MNNISLFCDTHRFKSKKTQTAGKSISNGFFEGRYIFIDWLSMKQKHFQILPIVNGSVVVKYDSDSGEIEFETHCFREHKGSFETTINVRCDGNTISISGNPSKYNRLDNLFGLRSLVDCISLYNQILAFYGLPFLVTKRAIITRIDITENYAVGSGNEIEHIRFLSSSNFRGESGYVYPDGNTCDWFRHSTRHYLKAYCKAAELKKHLTRADKKNNYSPSELDYLHQLQHNVDNAGVVRLEYEINSNILRDKKLRVYKGEIMGELVQLFDNKNPYKQKSKYITQVDSSNIYKIAIEEGFTNRQAINLRNNYELWLNGANLKQRYSRARFWAIKRDLKICGVDITLPMTVERLQYNMKNLHALPLMPSDQYIAFEHTVQRLAK